MNINLLGCYTEGAQDSMQLKRKYDTQSRAADRQWARTTQHIFNSKFMQTVLLRDTLERKLPNAHITAYDVDEIRLKHMENARVWKPRIALSDITIVVIGKYYARQELARLGEYARRSNTIIVCVDEWLIHEIAKDPSLIADLNKYAAIFEHSQLSVEKLRKAGLSNVQFMAHYRIHDEAAKAQAASRTHDSLRRAVVYSGVGSVVGTDQAVNAIKLANKKLPAPIKLDIYGPCSELEGDNRLDWIDKIIAGDPNIEYRGELDSDTDIATLSQADLGLQLPSLSNDNVPTSVVAMLASGLPLIIGNVRYAPEAVKEGKNGYIAAQNDVRDAANAIVQLANQPETLRRFGANSRALHKAVFSEEAATRGLIDTITKLSETAQQPAIIPARAPRAN
jgi:glycosyltransferase involved in cell wall biosynthesis